jgi:hypothetical protein
MSPHRTLHGAEQYEDCKDLSNSKNIVFDVNKLFNDSMDLTLWQRGGKKQQQWNKQQIWRI